METAYRQDNLVTLIKEWNGDAFLLTWMILAYPQKLKSFKYSFYSLSKIPQNYLLIMEDPWDYLRLILKAQLLRLSKLKSMTQ